MVPTDSNSTADDDGFDQTLDQLGEQALIQRLARFAAPGQLDDDTAEINPEDKPLLVTTDVLVDGVHFSPTTTSAQDVGWRAVAANLSDLAASGAERIEGITVGLVAPGNTRWGWVEAVYEGISEALDRFGGSLLGGDCSRGDQTILAITAFATLGPLRLLRSQAKPGDWLIVSGPHGLSRLGLALLQAEQQQLTAQVPAELQQQAIVAHQRPRPRLDGMGALVNCKPQDIPWRAGGTDSSDGLLTALKGLCEASNCQALLRPTALPRAPGWPQGPLWDQWCLSGGEDFELVLSLPESWARAWLAKIPGSRQIGVMGPGEARVCWDNGQELKAVEAGFEHFGTTC